jgi:hypothetical protein
LSLPTDFPIARTARSALSVVAARKLMSPASKGLLGATEVAKASPPKLGSLLNRLAGEPSSGLPEASLAPIVTLAGPPLWGRKTIGINDVDVIANHV